MYSNYGLGSKGSPRRGDIYITNTYLDKELIFVGRVVLVYEKLLDGPSENIWVVFCADYKKGEDLQKLIEVIQQRAEDILSRMDDYELNGDGITFPGFDVHTYEREMALPAEGYHLYGVPVFQLREPKLPFL